MLSAKMAAILSSGDEIRLDILFSFDELIC